MKDKIEKVLLYLGISPSQFADELGVQRSGISHILSERNKPSLEFIQKVLMKYKEINPEWLMTGKGEMLRGSVQRSLFSQTPDEIDSKTISKTESESKIINHNIEIEKLKELTIDTLVSENHSKPHDNYSEPILDILKNNGDNSKEIEKIVLFYKDKTFSVYKPE